MWGEEFISFFGEFFLVLLVCCRLFVVVVVVWGEEFINLGGGGASFPCATILRLIPECYRGAGSLISISCHSIADHCKDEGPLPLLEGSSHQFFLQVIILDREKHAVPMILRRNTHRGGAERVHKLISCNREVPQCGPCTFHDLPWSQPLGGQSCNKTVQPGIRGPFSSPYPQSPPPPPPPLDLPLSFTCSHSRKLAVTLTNLQ